MTRPARTRAIGLVPVAGLLLTATIGLSAEPVTKLGAKTPKVAAASPIPRALPQSQPAPRAVPPGRLPAAINGPPQERLANPDLYPRRVYPAPLPMPRPEGRVSIRLAVPEGRVIVFTPDGQAHPYARSAQVGLKPRERYAFAVEQVSSLSKERFHGTIELIRGPHVPPNVRASDFPVPIVFNHDDIDAIVRDRMITKVIVLECAETALGFPTEKNEPIRYEANAGRDPVKLAKELGEIVLVARLGTRVPTEAELVDMNPPGSVLLPAAVMTSTPKSVEGEAFQKTSGVAPANNSVRRAGHAHSSAPPLAVMGELGRIGGDFAGSVGPGLALGFPINNGAAKEGLVCDGGDRLLPVARGADGQLVNVDPADTVGEFQHPGGKRGIVASNCICVFSPRYVEVRLIQGAEGYQQRQLAGLVHRETPPDEMVHLTADAQSVKIDGPRGVRMRMRPSGFASEQYPDHVAEVMILEASERIQSWATTVMTDGPKPLTGAEQAMVARRAQLAYDLTRIQFPQVVGSLKGANEVLGIWKQAEVRFAEPIPKEPGCLVLDKSVSTPSAQIGDEVTFTIRFTNVGQEEIRNVAIVDSLLPRLDYVPKSATSSLASVFTEQANEAGAVLLRWELKDPLKGGQRGEVTFKAKIR